MGDSFLHALVVLSLYSWHPDLLARADADAQAGASSGGSGGEKASAAAKKLLQGATSTLKQMPFSIMLSVF